VGDVTATLMVATRHHHDARRTTHVRAGDFVAAMRAAVAHAVTMHAVTVHALRGSGSGSKHHGSGGDNQS